MANQETMRIRTEAALQLLQRGTSLQSVAMLLQAEFDISQSSAYRIAARASEQLAASDDGPATEDLSQQTLDADLALMLQGAALRAAHAGDHKAVASLVSSLDKIRRWNGTLQETSQPTRRFSDD